MAANNNMHVRSHKYSITVSTSQQLLQGQPDKTNLDFNEARDDGLAVASAVPHANHLHLTPDRQQRELVTQFFTGQMLFLTPNQRCQSTSGG